MKYNKPNKKYYTVPWWDETIDALVLKYAKTRELSEQEWSKLYDVFSELAQLVYDTQVSARGIYPSISEADDIRMGIKNHALEYALKNFDPAKYPGKIMNFFIVCGRRECFRHCKQFFRRDNNVKSIEAFRLDNDETSDSYDLPYLSVTKDYQEVSDVEYQDDVTRKQILIFDEVYKYYTGKNYKNKKRVKLLQELNKYFHPKAGFDKVGSRLCATDLYRKIEKDLGPNTYQGFAVSAMRQMVSGWLKHNGYQLPYKRSIAIGENQVSKKGVSDAMKQVYRDMEAQEN